jgi:(1->4)-alpha-D-glucan 1-alpha-D-glucosylmutase
VVPERSEITEEDRERIEWATQCAKDNRHDIDGSLFDFMRDVLTLKVTGKQESEFVYRFQQFTSPVMAKGVEDTAFYCSNKLTALSEVGGDPDCAGFSVEHFHAYNAQVQRSTPATMTTLSTHDTKRSDDVRARLLVLSEAPDAFAEAVQRWSVYKKKFRRRVHSDLVDPGTEWFLYQTLVGAWPISAERLKAYMQKAMREAKVRTSWVSNNADYERAVDGYIDALLGDKGFVGELEAFVGEIVEAGRVNSLAQTLLKYTAPGVPDMYQGGELWDLSLVDPDNRRPVDYGLRCRLLGEMETMNVGQVMERMDEGLPKLWVVKRALELRNERPEWFGEAYVPVMATGARAERVIAYLRGDSVLTVVSRWSHKAAAWGDAAIVVPEGRWRNRMTGAEVYGGAVMIGDLLREFPVGLLVRI